MFSLFEEDFSQRANTSDKYNHILLKPPNLRFNHPNRQTKKNASNYFGQGTHTPNLKQIGALLIMKLFPV